MDFQKLMQTMRDIDECGDTMPPPTDMAPPMQVPQQQVPQQQAPQTPPPTMSVNFNAQGIDNIDGMMKLFRAVNPDMMPKNEPQTVVTSPQPISAKISLNDEAYANEPDENEFEIDDAIFGGNDLHKEKGTYPKVAGGDNPMHKIGESYIDDDEGGNSEWYVRSTWQEKISNDAHAGNYNKLLRAIRNEFPQDLLSLVTDHSRTATMAAKGYAGQFEAGLTDLLSILGRRDYPDFESDMRELLDDAISGFTFEIKNSKRNIRESYIDDESTSSVGKYVKAVKDAIEAGVIDPDMIETDFFDQMSAFDVEYDKIADRWTEITGEPLTKKTPLGDNEVEKLASFNKDREYASKDSDEEFDELKFDDEDDAADSKKLYDSIRSDLVARLTRLKS